MFYFVGPWKNSLVINLDHDKIYEIDYCASGKIGKLITSNASSFIVVRNDSPIKIYRIYSLEKYNPSDIYDGKLKCYTYTDMMQDSYKEHKDYSKIVTEVTIVGTCIYLTVNFDRPWYIPEGPYYKKGMYNRINLHVLPVNESLVTQEQLNSIRQYFVEKYSKF